MAIETRLQALDPPPKPRDLIQSALLIPLDHISEKHKGRKVRVIGQVLAYDIQSALLLLSSGNVPMQGKQRRETAVTLLVDTTTALLGQSPSATDVSHHQESTYSKTGPTLRATTVMQSSSKYMSREILKLDHGEWVCVVGWLDGETPKRFKQIDGDGSFRPPLPFILEAIHISASRLPPIDAIYRGTSG